MMDDLIKRLEKAEDGSRELDAEIWQSSGTMPEGLEDVGYFPDPAKGCMEGSIYAAPHYTTSLDAALTLVPEGWEIQLFKKLNGSKCRLKRVVDYYLVAPMENSEWEEDRLVTTSALALCIAALKARDVT